MHDEPTVVPSVAPFESCVSCFRGDTRTIVFIEGEAEWHIAGLSRLAGIPLDQADATFMHLAEHVLGCDRAGPAAARPIPGCPHPRRTITPARASGPGKARRVV
jgi:hypothetical protein